MCQTIGSKQAALTSIVAHASACSGELQFAVWSPQTPMQTAGTRMVARPPFVSPETFPPGIVPTLEDALADTFTIASHPASSPKKFYPRHLTARAHILDHHTNLLWPT